MKVVALAAMAVVAIAAVVTWLVLRSDQTEARVDLRSPVTEQADFTSLTDAEHYAGMPLPEPSTQGWTFRNAEVLKRAAAERDFVEVRMQFQGLQVDQWVSLRIFSALTLDPANRSEGIELWGLEANLSRQGLGGELVTITWENSGTTYYAHAQVTRTLSMEALLEFLESLSR